MSDALADSAKALAYLALLIIFFVVLAPLLLLAGTLAGLLYVLVSYAEALNAGLGGRLAASRNQAPRGSEPAFTSYFFYKAYRDIRDVWLRSSDLADQRISAPLQRIWDWAFSEKKQIIFRWPARVVVVAVAGLVLLGGILLLLPLFALHSLVVVVAGALLWLGAMLLWLAELLLLLWRQAQYVCPHPNCYRSLALPEYHCPFCNAEHKRLLPGTYGTIQRKCRCGHFIPTSALFGRHSLAAYCPHCKGELSGAIGAARNIHVPVIGGPSTGKSTAITRIGIALAQVFQPPFGEFSLPESGDQQRFEQERRELDSGGKLLKTTDLSPRALLMLLSRAHQRCVLLYVYDPAGELYRTEGDDRRRQRYLHYATGFLFLIDPFSLPSIRATYAAALLTQPELEPSDEPPQSVYERLMNQLRVARHYPQRISVVITKLDAFDLAEQVLGAATGEAASAEAIRHWLIANGEENLVRSLHRDFQDVRYFPAKLRGPGYRAQYVLDPLGAALGSRKLIGAEAVVVPQLRAGQPEA